MESGRRGDRARFFSDVHSRRMRETAQIATWGITIRYKYSFFFMVKVVKNWNRDLKKLRNILEIFKN